MALPFDTNINWYLNFGNGTSTGYWAVTPWAANTAVTVGTLRRQVNPAFGLERVFVCAKAGTTHATTQPTWVTSRGSATTDNTVTWIEVTGTAAMNGDLSGTSLRPVGTTSVAVGYLIKRANGASYQICTTAQITFGSTEPAFSDVAGVTTTDSAAVWTSLGPVGNFAAWGAPMARFLSLINYGDQRLTSGQTAYVAHEHAEVASVAYSVNGISQYYSNANFKVICVDKNGAVPPGAADLRTTASVATTGTNNLTLNIQNAYFYGLIFGVGSGTTSGVFTIQSSSAIFENCRFRKMGTSSAPDAFKFGGSRHIGTTFEFGAVDDGIAWITGSTVEFFPGTNPNPIVGSVVPTFFLQGYSSSGYRITVNGLDLTSIGAGKILANADSGGIITLRSCKINSAATVWNSNDANSAYGSTVYLSQSDSGTGVKRNEKYSMQGAQTTEQIVVATDGAKDGTVPVSWKVVSRAYTVRLTPFRLMPLAAYSTAVATPVTATINGMVNATALPTNAEIWMEMDYLGDASSTLGTRIGNGFANVFSSATAHSSSTVAWDSLATARANSTAYTVGQVVKVSSNAGRVFFCITAGTSAASLPSGFASAIDGGSVTDGGAVFRAAMRFSMALVLNSPAPAYAQLLTANLSIGKASTTFYLDPKLTLT